MIEHHRDEELCRRWDARADEDHTHHLTAQEFFHYKNGWWLHSNKQGSNTMPLRNRSDFKLVLSTLQRLQKRSRRRTTRAYFTLTSTNNGSWHKVHLLHDGFGKVPLIRCGHYLARKSIWENQHLFLIMYSWGALKDNVK